MTIIHTLIVVASIRQRYISQLDVKNTLLNGDLQKEVYMAPSPSVSHNSRYVCKLKKALYGLKQAPRAWFEKLSIVILFFEFVFNSHDFAIFY
jgi:histone deacetylase 1/2